MLKLVGKCKVFVNTFEKSVKVKGKTKKVNKTTYSCCIKSNDDETLYANLYFANGTGFEDIESGDRIEVSDAFIIGNRAYGDNAYLAIYVNAFEFVLEEETETPASKKRVKSIKAVEGDGDDEEVVNSNRKGPTPETKKTPAIGVKSKLVKTKNKIADLLAYGYTMDEINNMSDSDFVETYKAYLNDIELVAAYKSLEEND